MSPAAAAMLYARSDALRAPSASPLLPDEDVDVWEATPLRAASRAAMLSSDMGATGVSKAAVPHHKSPAKAFLWLRQTAVLLGRFSCTAST